MGKWCNNLETRWNTVVFIIIFFNLIMVTVLKLYFAFTIRVGESSIQHGHA